MANPTSTNLVNSIRKVSKATYVPLTLASDLPDTGRAILKFGYVRQLNLQPGEVDQVQQGISVAGAVFSAAGVSADANFWSLLKQFEASPLPSQLPSPSVFSAILANSLMAFGKVLIAIRKQAIQPSKLGDTRQPATEITSAATQIPDVAIPLQLLNAATVADNIFTANISATPVGMLNLERLEMTPAGLERGELLATIPLAPKERTGVVQQEWSVTSQEFSSIVTDSLENFSETGVTENTELAQSTNSQIDHSNQFNINATASGGCGFVSGSTAITFGTQDHNSVSAADSRKDAINTTRKASSRVKQSHKMTIATTSVTGQSETTTRMLENPSSTDPIRIDYFSLMRKWYVALYRYGLRLTYDIGVPEPGGAMRAIYEQVSKLKKKANQPFTFDVQYADINLNNLTAIQQLAEQYGAQLPSTPSGDVQYIPSQTAQTPSDPDKNYYIIPLSINFSIEDGQQIDRVEVNYNIGENHAKWIFSILGYPTNFVDPGATYPYEEWNYTNVPLPNFLVGATGSVTITCIFQYANPAIVSFNIYTVPSASAVSTWQAGVYEALYNAAQSSYYTQQQGINAQIAALQDQINGVDTLTLRREENEEIMKCVLRWLLGPQFDFMPNEVTQLYKNQGNDALYYGVGFTGNDVSLDATDWTTMFMYQEMVKFINEAIEWENVVYYLYSYFWDVPNSWPFIRQIQHPDSTRQAFLRAGSARIVLTVRPGYEQAWMSFVEQGDFGLILPPGHPYLTIAQQIQAYNSTNYPGIPPANPNGGGPVDDDAPQVGTTCSTEIASSNSPVSIPVADSTGFVVGATAIIDNWEADVDPTTGVGIQETQTITAVPDKTHVTVQALQYTHVGSPSVPIPIVQAGAKGVLIGEWFEYTPTSGVDIAVTTNTGATNLGTPPV